MAAWITEVAGSSDYFRGGAVTYANEAKERQLDVPGDLLARAGAVSREVAEAMAAGARRRFETDWAVAVTGIAGPGGGSADKPVGTVHIAVAGPAGAGRHVERVFPGDRARIRVQTVRWSLDTLRRCLLSAV